MYLNYEYIMCCSVATDRNADLYGEEAVVCYTAFLLDPRKQLTYQFPSVNADDQRS